MFEIKLCSMIINTFSKTSVALLELQRILLRHCGILGESSFSFTLLNCDLCNSEIPVRHPF